MQLRHWCTGQQQETENNPRTTSKQGRGTALICCEPVKGHILRKGHSVTPLLPVSLLPILHSQLLELLIHFLVEVISEEEGPEPEERVHLLGLTNAQPFSLCLGRRG